MNQGYHHNYYDPFCFIGVFEKIKKDNPSFDFKVLPRDKMLIIRLKKDNKYIRPFITLKDIDPTKENNPYSAYSEDYVKITLIKNIFKKIYNYTLDISKFKKCKNNKHKIKKGDTKFIKNYYTTTSPPM